MSTTNCGGESPPLRRSRRNHIQKKSTVDDIDEDDTKAKANFNHAPSESNATADSKRMSEARAPTRRSLRLQNLPPIDSQAVPGTSGHQFAKKDKSQSELSSQECQIASDACRGCKKIFPNLNCHLAKKEVCRKKYSEEEIQAAKTAKIKAKKLKYRTNNKDKLVEKHKVYNLKNKSKITEKQKQYNLKNRNEIVEKQRKYNLKKRSEIVEKQKKYNKKNQSEIVEKQKKYNKKNQSEIVEKQKKYNLKNRSEIVEKQRKYNLKNQEAMVKKHRQYNKEKGKQIAQKQKKYNREHREEINEKQQEYREKYVNKRQKGDQWLEDLPWPDAAMWQLQRVKPKYREFGGPNTHREVMFMDPEQLVDLIRYYKMMGHPDYHDVTIDYSLMQTSNEIPPEKNPANKPFKTKSGTIMYVRNGLFQSNPENCEIGLSNEVLFPGEKFCGEEVTEYINVIVKLKTMESQPEVDKVAEVTDWPIIHSHLIQTVMFWKRKDHLALRGIRFQSKDRGAIFIPDWESSCKWSEAEREANEEKVVKSWKHFNIAKPRHLLEKYHKSYLMFVEEFEGGYAAWSDESDHEEPGSSENSDTETGSTEGDDMTHSDSEDSTYNEPKFLIRAPYKKPDSCYCSDRHMCDTCFCEQRGITKKELIEITEPMVDLSDNRLRILADNENKLIIKVPDNDYICYCEDYICSKCFCIERGISEEEFSKRTEYHEVRISQDTNEEETILKLLPN